jgi:hexosaminidase
MPLPAHCTVRPGSFSIDGGFQIVFEGYSEPRLERARQRFLVTLGRETGILRWSPAQSAGQLVITTKAASAPVQQVGEDESYRLNVTPNQIRLDAPNPLGVLRGLQTLLQLAHTSPQGFIVSAASIDDRPRFPWRGLMIDTGRHFMPANVIRENLDAMEAAKLNVLHWHVSDDEGERIESKVFPLLQQKGSDGQYYSQAEVREIIQYARDRGIRVYPEVEMPSHAGSFFVGYPQLADGTGPYRLKYKLGQRWERKRDPAEDSSMDPTRESTYEFLDRFIGEMSGLFPDAYFHAGGDAEDAIIEWGTNPRMRQYMSEHGMKDTAALQAYFSGRVQRLVAKHGKTMIGWDEVLTPETPKEVVIQSWRGLDALALSTGSGHPGILSWGYYLDLNEPASRHYAVDPLDGPTAKLAPAQQNNILGGEAAMWTEYATREIITGRIWPQAAVIAEGFRLDVLEAARFFAAPRVFRPAIPSGPGADDAADDRKCGYVVTESTGKCHGAAKRLS